MKIAVERNKLRIELTAGPEIFVLNIGAVMYSTGNSAALIMLHDVERAKTQIRSNEN